MFVEARAQFLKFVIYKNHINAINLFNQVPAWCVSDTWYLADVNAASRIFDYFRHFHPIVWDVRRWVS